MKHLEELRINHLIQVELNEYVMLFFICLFLFSCNDKKTNTNSVEVTDSIKKQTEVSYPITIDKSCQKSRDIEIHDIAEVFYIKMETNKKCLFSRKWGFSGIYLTDSDLFISFGENILRYSLDGVFLNSIGQRGGSPFEFNVGGIFSINESTKELFLLDIVKQRILVYGYDGKHIRNFRVGAYFDRFCVLNDSLAICSNNDVNSEDRSFIISLKDGAVKKVLLENARMPNVKNLMTNIGAFARTNKFKNYVYLCISTSDTIYAYDCTKDTLEPAYIQSPLNNRNTDDVKTVPYLQFESSAFSSIFIGDRPMSNFTFWVDKKTGEVAKVRLKNKDLDDYVLGWGTNVPNVIFDILEMPNLKEALQKGKLSGELKTLVESSDEEDNPIIMIAKIAV